ncbi:hypothetical protein NDU88_002158 [Pleurodeles waltl]|uniref:Uncharacterized protein n=1 Tax=Pleurodeles waltl TaxID=8319 RepID=A0AAV7QAW1_PLEWA|nr:hypothetical protein NDU88_002158 [Pleurodeles waltl]
MCTKLRYPRGCDGLAGTRPHTPPTCAVTACGVPEHHGISTNERGATGTTQEDGKIRRSASGLNGKKESGVKADQGEEERDGGTRDQEDTEARTPDRRIWGTGGKFLRDRRNKDDEDHEGDWNNAATWEAERNNPPRFWRSVADPGVSGKGGRVVQTQRTKGGRVVQTQRNKGGWVEQTQENKGGGEEEKGSEKPME